MDEGTRTGKDRVSLLAVGDIMMGDHPICIGHGVASTIKKNGPRFIFEKVASALRESDVVFGNLETVISHKNLNEKSLRSAQLRASPESVEGLKYAGFNVLSLANNHIMDHGREAMLDTMKILSENNIKCLMEGAEEQVVFDIKGMRIAFIAFNLVKEETIGEIVTAEKIIERVTSAKELGDILIVSLHWGDEYISRPSPKQIEMGRKIIDAGANLVIGHHPHVLQGIERYNSGMIAYSLGNFVFDMHQKKMRESVILNCNLSKALGIEINIIPIFISDSYQPEIIIGDEARKVAQKIKQLTSEIEKEDLSDIEIKMKKYLEEVKLWQKQYGKESRRYFLRNLHRYPVAMLPQLMAKSIKQRTGSK
jgi:poly-gamma-glutamate synthesis protein (capsule biosynthesis protein)